MRPSVRQFVTIAACALAARGASNAQAQMFGQAGYPLGGSPSAVATVDWNLDGRPDVIAAEAGAVELLLNGPGGVLQPGNAYIPPTSLAVQKMRCADLQGDGLPDLVAADAGKPFLILFGNGSGLGAASQTGAFPSGNFEIADMNGDGKPDLVASGAPTAGVRIFINNGAGAFPSAQSFASGGAAFDVAVGDWNHDGFLDVAAACGPELTVWLGDGAGHLGAAASLQQTAGITQQLAAGDADGDGKPDLVESNAPNATNPGTLSVFHGNGAGGFALASTSASNAFPTSLALADLDGDGDLDAVQGSVFGPGVLVRYNNGAGVWTNATADAICKWTATPRDMDGDGVPDLVLATDGVQHLIVLHADGAGGFHPKSVTTAGAIAGTIHVTADWNGDGNPDLVVAGSAGVMILFGAGDGSFFAPAVLSQGKAIAAAALHVNGDLWIDLVVAFASGPNVVLATFLGNGGIPAAPITTFVAAPPGSAVMDVQFTDVDVDGHADACILCAPTSAGLPSYVILARGVGNGSYAVVPAAPYAKNLQFAALADVIADGYADLIAVNSTAAGQELYVQSLVGLAPSATGSTVPAAVTGIGAIRACDLNGDGAFDVLVTSPVAIQAFAGNGFGVTPLVPQAIVQPAEFVPSQIALDDFGGDGRLDFVHCGDLYQGAGAGSLAIWGSVGSGYAVATADFDLDGRPDLVANNGNISVQLNQLGTPAGAALYGAGTPGCGGRIAAQAAAAPHIGEQAFGLLCSNAPKSQLGLFLVTDVPDVQGSDPFFLGFVLHVSFAGAMQINALDVVATISGSGFVPIPLPVLPSIVGNHYYAQPLFLERIGSTCSPSPLGFVSGAAVDLTILP